jgi:formylglycine-generating enzyme required for sulfatase activity
MGGVYNKEDKMGDIVTNPFRDITISPFYMAKYETTWKQWSIVKEWAFKNGYNDYWFKMDGEARVRYISKKGKTPEERKALGWASNPDSYPVNVVNFTSMITWCNALSEYEGRTPVYYTDKTKTKVHRGNSKSSSIGHMKYAEKLTVDCVDWLADGYRLPTEAEWEYACRAGSNTKYSFGDTWDSAYGVVTEEEKPSNQPVGQKKPNAFGFYDMHGNVWEVCWDWFAPYPEEVQTDPRGAIEGALHYPLAKKKKAKPFINRVMRGGAAYNKPTSSRSAHRNRYWHCAYYAGFRIVTKK